MQRLARLETLMLLAVILVGGALRLAGLGSVPPGPYRDEAFNGLDALNILRGQHALYFAANNGREPMFIYLVALSVGALGRSPFALRLPSALVSLLTLPATYLMARELFDKRVGLIAAAVLAVTLWPVHLAHIGLRVGLLPLFAALIVWQGARGARTGRARHWIAAGILYGLSFYTYLAARITPIAIVIFVIYLWFAHPRERAAMLRAALPFTPAALIVVAPLAVYALGHWDVVMGRGGQVIVFNPGIGGPHPWLTLAGNVARALGMFFWRGDFQARHNLPLRPVFDPVMSVFFLAGIVIALVRARRDAACALALIWTAVMLLPTILAEDTPHFLRAVGVLPVVMVFPALALSQILDLRKLSTYGGSTPSKRASDRHIWDASVSPEILEIGSRKLEGRGRKTEVGEQRAEGNATRQHPNSPLSTLYFLHRLLMLAVVLTSLAFTSYDYFARYARDQTVRFWFDDAGTQLAAEINRFVGTGWTGNEWSVPDKSPLPDRHVFLDQGLWEGASYANTQFLVPHRSALTLIKTGGELPSPNPGPTLLLLWPYADWRRDLALLPRQSVIEVREGALTKGDRDPEPIVNYLVIRAEPYSSAPAPLARFGAAPYGRGGPQLVGAEVTGARVRLMWYAPQAPDADYVVFVHALRDGARVAQHDGDPADGLYPMSQWRPGDVVVDGHVLSGAWDVKRDQVVVGLYRRDNGERLSVVDAAGNVIDDSAPIR